MADAVAEVAELLKSSDWTAGQWNGFAAVYAVASAKTADKRAAYADAAMAALAKAVSAGYNDVSYLKTNSHFDPLRDRDDFKQLVAQLATPTPNQQEPQQLGARK